MKSTITASGWKEWALSRETIMTAVLGLTFICLGIGVSSFGPVLLELGERCNATVGQMGAVVTGRSFMYMVATIVVGSVPERVDRTKICAVATFIGGVILIGFTVVRAYWALCIVVMIQGISFGLVDATGNTALINTFKNSDKNMEPYMQALHFGFAIGALLAPIIIGTIMDKNFGNFNDAFYVMIFIFSIAFIALVVVIVKKLSIPRDTETNGSLVDQSQQVEEKTLWQRLKYPFWEGLTIGMCGLFIATYAGLEVTTGTLIYTYVVKSGIGDENVAYSINAGFWGTLTIGRFVAVFTSQKFLSEHLVLVNCVGSFFAVLMIVIDHTSLAVLWIGILFFGFFLASQFASIFNFAEKLVGVSSISASFLLVSGTVGEMVFPAATASSFDNASENSRGLPIFLLILSLVLCGLSGFLFLIKRKIPPEAMKSNIEAKIEQPPATPTTIATGGEIPTSSQGNSDHVDLDSDSEDSDNDKDNKNKFNVKKINLKKKDEHKVVLLDDDISSTSSSSSE